MAGKEVGGVSLDAIAVSIDWFNLYIVEILHSNSLLHRLSLLLKLLLMPS